MGTLSSTGNNSEGDGESGLLKNCSGVRGRRQKLMMRRMAE